jgi:hypothetical protein
VSSSANPYDWQGYRPQVVVLRPEVASVLARLQRGGSAVVLAGRGMGKSVFLQQLEAAAAELPDMRVLRFPAPPPELSYRACLRALAYKLGADTADALDSGELIAGFLRQADAPRRLILLYDEFDRYARPYPPSATEHPGRDFFNDLEAMRKEYPVGILAAGSIGVFVFRDVLGSGFLSRAEQVLLRPFERPELRQLAQPYFERGNPLSEGILELLLLATGGNPALVTYGLERLWSMESVAGLTVAGVFAEFQSRHREYLRDFQRSFADERLSGAPQRIWELVRRSTGPVFHRELQAACGPSKEPLLLDFVDVLDLLRTAGLVRLQGSANANPVVLQPISSILNLPSQPSTAQDFRDRFLGDLESLLAQLHALSADFFRPGTGKRTKHLVPEASFSGMLAMGFQNLGWRVEREAQYGAGRTDLKLGREDSDKVAVIELKIWGRRHQEVQRQIESYWSNRVAAGAVVMLTDRKHSDWPDRYQRECLEPWKVEVERRSDSASPITARFACRSITADGMEARVDHYLLRIDRRR